MERKLIILARTVRIAGEKKTRFHFRLSPQSGIIQEREVCSYIEKSAETATSNYRISLLSPLLLRKSPTQATRGKRGTYDLSGLVMDQLQLQLTNSCLSCGSAGQNKINCADSRTDLKNPKIVVCCQCIFPTYPALPIWAR